MNQAAIQDLLRLMKCDQIKPKGNGWVSARCPLAVWRHKGGKDEHPSFAMGPGEDGQIRYNCFAGSCLIRGTLPYLVWHLQQYLGASEHLTAIATFLGEHASSVKPTQAFLDRLAQASYKPAGAAQAALAAPTFDGPAVLGSYPEPEALPESTLEVFTADFPPEVLEYLTGTGTDDLGRPRRGLSRASLKLWELGWHPQARRISIPVRDLRGKLVGVSGRAFDPGQKPKFLHTDGFKSTLTLYGEDKITPGFGIGHFVEGFFDVIMLRQWGYPAVAVMGASLSRPQLAKASKLFGRGRAVGDGDEAGVAMTTRLVNTLSPKMPAAGVTIPQGLDPDQLSPADREELLGAPTLAPVVDAPGSY